MAIDLKTTIYLIKYVTKILLHNQDSKDIYFQHKRNIEQFANS